MRPKVATGRPKVAADERRISKSISFENTAILRAVRHRACALDISVSRYVMRLIELDLRKKVLK